MAVYDDYDGVYFSIQALRMYHDIVKSEDVELIIVDNNPSSNSGKTTQRFANHAKARYIPYTEKASTAIRNEIFANASGKYTISMDCHVLFMPNAIESLLDYYNKNPNCKDIVQGPLIYDHLQEHNPSTHFKEGWNHCMYGTWATDKESMIKNEPFEIPMQGLGVFSCETKNWLGFNENFRGFGGEEGYIHHKFRQAGGKAVCLPQFQWVHRFDRPAGVPYKLILEDRIWNYFVGWLELTQDPEHEMIKGAYEHFKDKIPEGSIDNILTQAIKTTIKGEQHAHSIA